MLNQYTISRRRLTVRLLDLFVTSVVLNCAMLLAIAMPLFCVSFITGNAQAPGDEDGNCKTHRYRPSVINQEILMWSFNYNDLIEKNGPWIILNEDDNNDGQLFVFSLTSVSNL